MTASQKKCVDFIDELERLRFSPDDLSAEERLNELTDLLDDVEDPSVVFPAIFSFFERNEGAEIGNPGPLVHFIERFYPSYLGLLIESVRRKPVEHTVWMVNRVLNDSAIPSATRQSLLQLLENTRDNPTLGEEIRGSAGDFLTHQKARGG